MKTLLKIRNFVFNMITFIIVWGNYITLGNCLTPLFADQFSPSKISIIGLIFVLTGVIGCYMMGLFIDRT